MTSLARKPLPSYPKSVPSATNGNQATTQAAASASANTVKGASVANQPLLRCRQCGAGVSLQIEDWAVLSEGAKTRIMELEGEVKFLTGKATTAADKLADYEEEISKLKAAKTHAQTHQQSANDSSVSSSNNDSKSSASSSNTDASHKPPPLQIQGSTTTTSANTPTSAPPATTESSASPSANTPVASPATAAAVAAAVSTANRPAASLGRSLTTTRITNFLAARRFSPASADTPKPGTPTTPEAAPDLTAALTHEQNLRRQAESKLKQTNLELEELSVSLFQQANEMVAAERKARVAAESKLEAKAAELEARSAMMEKRGTELERSHSELVNKGEQWERKGDARDKAGEQRTRALEKRCKWLEERVKALEAREKEKVIRLDRLEKAMGRVGRVKGLLSEGKAG